MFESSDSEEAPNSLDDLGPVFHHYYEIQNQGPHAVGNMEVQITWPLKVNNGRVCYGLRLTKLDDYFCVNFDHF